MKLILPILGLMFVCSFASADIAPPPPAADTKAMFDLVQKYQTNEESDCGMGTCADTIENLNCTHKKSSARKLPSAKCTYGKKNAITGKAALNLMAAVLKTMGKEAQCGGGRDAACFIPNSPVAVTCTFSNSEGTPKNCYVTESSNEPCPVYDAPMCKTGEELVIVKTSNGCDRPECKKKINGNPGGAKEKEATESGK